MSSLVDVGALDDFAPDSARRVVVDGIKVAVVRIADEFYAIGDVCSHADISLSEGELFCAEREIECWKHGSSFSLLTGAPLTLPATQPVPVFKVVAVDGRVLVNTKVEPS